MNKPVTSPLAGLSLLLGLVALMPAEEVEEEGLGEGVELGEGGAALGPQRLRPVQHLRNPPLLCERRHRNRQFCEF